MGMKIIKTNKTMIFTQNNLFWCIKKNLWTFFFPLLASKQRYAETHAAKMRINGQQNDRQTAVLTR